MTKPKRRHWGDPGSRVRRKTDAMVFSRGSRCVIVTVYPSGVIGFRLERERREEFASASDIYRQAARARVVAEKAKRRAERKAR